MTKKELFDLEAFLQQYGELTVSQLHSARTKIMFEILEYQKEEDSELPIYSEKFADFQNKKIEVALLEKLTMYKNRAELFKCPDCGVLCSTDEDNCHQCGRKL